MITGISVLLFGCGGGDGNEAVDLTHEGAGGIYYGEIFKFNEVENFRHLYPHNVTEAVSMRIVSQIYEGLVKFDQSNIDDLVPGIAERWEVNPDATKFTFHLKKGITFHDDPCFPNGKGREVTATDVKYCFDLLCTESPDNQMFWLFKDRVKGANAHYEASKVGKAPAGGVEGVRILNDSTVEIELDIPFGGFLKLLATPGGYIFPKEAVETYGDDLRVKAVGTGPFTIRKVSEGDVVILQRNPNYWQFDEYGNQLPYLDGIKITFQKEKKTELNQFPDNLHMVYQLPIENINEVLGDFETALQGGNEPFQMQHTASLSTQFYGFLHSNGVMQDVRVRKAFNMAIDREELVTYILRGEGIAAEGGVVPPSFPTYPSDEISGYEFNPEEAQRLLAEAGYPGGRGLEGLTLQLNSGGTINEKVAQNLQKMFETNLGVTVQLNVQPLSQHYQMVETGSSNFWRAAWLADYPDPENFLYIFHSKHVPDSIEGRSYLNPFRYSSARFDSLYDAAMAEPENDRRMKLLAMADQQMIDDAAVMPIYYDEVIRLVNSRVQNFPINTMEYRDFTRVWFEKLEETEE